MLHFSYKHRGVISVFLSLILLPVFLFSCLLIDGTRVYSTQSMMSSAGDLTMNTALSNFDSVVKDVYGLMTMSDDPSEMADNLETYMKDMLYREAGISVEGTDTENMIYQLCQLIAGADEDVTYENIINIQLENLEAMGVDGSALANADVLENQIVEYMKYRGPVTLIADGVLSKFSQLKGLDKQLKAVEAEADYQEQLAVTGDSLKNAYQYLKKYQELAEENSLYNKDVYVSDFDGIDFKLQDAFEKIYVLKYLMDLESDGTFPYWDPYEERDSVPQKSCSWAYEVISDLNDDDVVTIIKYVFSADKSQITLPESEEDIIDAYETLLSYMIDAFEDEGWLTYNAANKTATGTMADFIDGFYDASVMTSVLTYLELLGGVKQENNIQAVNAMYAYWKVFCYYAEYNKDNVSKDYEYYRIISEYAADASDNIHKDFIMSEDIPGWTSALRKWKDALETEFKDALENIERGLKHYEAVVNAYYYLAAAYGWLLQAEEDVAALDAARNTWSDAVNKMDAGETKTNFAGRVKASENIDLEELETLETVVSEYANYYYAVLEEYKEFVYAPDILLLPTSNVSGVWVNSSKQATSVEEFRISDAETSEDAVYEAFLLSDGNGLNFNSSGDYIDEVEKEAKEYVHLAVGIPSFDNIPASDGGTELTGNSFYQKLKEWFDSENTLDGGSEAVQNAKNSYNDLFKKTDDTSTESTLGDYKDDLEELIKSISGTSSQKDDDTDDNTSIDNSDTKNYQKVSNSATSVMSSASGFLSKITSFLGKALENQRDILYVGTYMLENFSCATTNLKDGENVETSEYETTLSGYSIDPYNNYLYRGELEYILWGNTDITKDVNNTKSLIYAIRFVLNTVYAFSAADIQSMTGSAATLMSCGVVFLQPLINVVLTMVLAAAESALDIKELMDGKDVVLYKNVDTWNLSLTGAMKTFVGYAVDEVFDKIEEMTTDGIDELTESVNGYIEQTEKSVQEAVANTIITPIISRLQAVAGQFTVSTTDVEKLVSDAVDEVLDQIESTLNQTTDSGLILEAEKQVVSYLRNNKSVFTDKMMEYFNKAYTGSGLNAAERVAELQTKMEEISKTAIESVFETISNAISSASEELRSAVEMACQEGGEAVKEKATTAINNYMSQLSGSTASGSTAISNANQSTSLSNSVNLNYKEYLTIFILVELEFNKTVMLQRMAALIQLNISKTASGKTKDASTKAIAKNENFSICNAYTMVGLSVDYHINTLFLNEDASSDLENAMLGENSGVSMTYQSFMGY